MNIVAFILAVAACIVFVIAWLGAATRINLVPLGLALLTAALVVQDCAGGADVTF